MRDILFRAKREKWIELPKEEWWIEGLPSYDIDGNMTEFEVYKGFASCEFVGIDPETICEYTGLTDKNGRRIFEGDILLAHFDDQYPEDITYAKVTWNGFSWCTRESTKDDVMSEFDCNTFEVCGNIFDNPELVKGVAE